MKIRSCVFKEYKLTEWNGRYARVPGSRSTFHLKNINGRLWPVVFWETEDGTGTCAACDCDAASQLADAVEAAKQKAGGNGGGAFIINEYGQVLVPASDGSGRRFLAGELNGQLLFENPFEEDAFIDLGDDSDLQPGDPWKLPYVGFPFNLNQRSNIYFYNVDEEGGQAIYPDNQDRSLIEAFRSVRRTGAVRFIVNPFGLVLTKCPISDDRSPQDQWQPVYIGKIDIKKWFEKESGRA